MTRALVAVALCLVACGEPGAVGDAGARDAPGTGCLTATPSTLDLGVLRVGVERLASITIVNGTSCSPVSIAAVATGADAAEITVTPGMCAGRVVGSGGSCAIALVLVPTREGVVDATIEIDGVDELVGPGARLVVPVQATVVDARPVLTPTSHFFGSVGIGSTSLPTRFFLENPHAFAVTGISVTMSGSGAAEFGISATTCGTMLAPSGRCTIDVVSTGTSSGGKTAALSVATSGGPIQASVSATVLTGLRLWIYPGRHDFGSVGVGTLSGVKRFVVTNPRPETLGPLEVSRQGSDQLEVVATTCEGALLTFEGTCTLDIRFSPTLAGASSAWVDVRAPTGGLITASVSGTAFDIDQQVLTPTWQELGTVYAGITSAPKMFTLTNVGGRPLTNISAAITGTNASELMISSNACTPGLSPGGTCTVGVVATTSTFGDKLATLAITTSGGTITAPISATSHPPVTIAASPTSHAFGTVADGSYSTTARFTITNTATGPTGPLGWYMTGVHASQFVILADHCSAKALAPGGTCTIDMRFQPAGSPGARGAVLNVRGSPGGTVEIALGGSAQ